MKKYHLFTQFTFMVLCYLFPNITSAQPTPIGLHPENPHYFIYKDQPTILITSGEHYGALMNLDFNYITYFNELQSKGLNLTRTFTGVYVEPQGAFNIASNTLAPAANRFICPWLRSSSPGYLNGGNKFDLTRWDDAYFKRLRNLVSEAQERGIVIELTLFCPFYEEAQWRLSPLNAINNINNAGTYTRTAVYTMDSSGALLTLQDALVRKIVSELKDFENVVYEICNEPYFGGVSIKWQRHVADVIAESEAMLKTRHLVSQNIANGSALITDPHDVVGVFNFHYATPPTAVTQNYGLNKVIGNNETGFNGNSDSTYRKQAWQFLLAGGGLFNNLDYSFTAGNENGTFVYPSSQPGGGTTRLRQQYGTLKQFLYSFDFVHMSPDSTFVVSAQTGSPRPYALAQTGKQYAVYFYRRVSDVVELKLPAGRYSVEWLYPSTGKKVEKTILNHTGSTAKLAFPPGHEDIALRLVNIAVRKTN